MTHFLNPLRRAMAAGGTALLASCASLETAGLGGAETRRLTPARIEALDAAVTQQVGTGEIPGALVVIAEGGEVTYSRSMGFASLEDQRPVTEDTLFRFYSMTKPITCATVMTLYDDGLIDLDTPISKYLPEFSEMSVRTEAGIVPATRPITIRHLMTHTSGLTYAILPGPVQADYAAADVFAIENRTSETLEAHVRRLARLPLVAEPGTVWNYGESMGVLGRLVEVVSGKSFGAYMRERILAPLSMDDTGFYVPPEKRERLAELYHLSQDRTLSNAQDQAVYGGSYLEKPLLEYGGAGLVGTASDYMNFAQMLLAAGRFGDAQVLSSEAVTMMTSNQLDASFGDAPLAASGRGEGTGFGLCGYVNTARPPGAAPGAIGEYGWSGWASTAFWIDPQNDLAGLVFTQVIPDDIGSVALSSSVREAVYNPVKGE
ncbi:beta-lactamase [Hyphomonas hirschiana VP5]|nr:MULTISPECIES: serine hydrolase domain-containing protein [Hyphomonas]KCZ93107.1 beta-lactamase [Hyphomonas hirschiana VP5]